MHCTTNVISHATGGGTALLLEHRYVAASLGGGGSLDSAYPVIMPQPENEQQGDDEGGRVIARDGCSWGV